MQVVETRTAKIFVDENNILHLLLYKNAIVDYEDAVDNFLVIKTMTNGEPCLKLIDIRCQVKIEEKARQFINTKDTQEKTIARAILINNSVKRMTFNFFIKFNALQIPTKFFANKKEAIDWLKSFQN